MKIKTLILSVLLTSLLFNCKKSCKKNIEKCQDSPENGMCTAAFENWFYAEGDNKCIKIGYSGCSEKGFKTKEQCEACICNH